MQKYYDLPEFARWEPARVVREVNEIDPSAFLEVSPKIANEDGSFDGESLELRQKGLDRRSIIKSYHRLGQFLHVPAISQRAKRKSQFDGLHDLCQSTVAILQTALPDKFSDIKVGINWEGYCKKCGGALRKRLPPGGRGQTLTCGNCHVRYDIEVAKNGDVVCSVLVTEVFCPRAGCGAKNRFFEGEAVLGRGFICGSCGESAKFSLTATEA